ncbi:hypothetical protein [Alkalibacter mobilis]|uniref:hypothetical protein n=1 Tax=Alkalibacter mobilis TaxID=2787712 RepID=UPI00189FEECA|nr:hypothetical protein [Alkalibacter mobilis]MBF7096896.1 hypothetical protein [Alkalibacter mobilis]
MLKILEVKNRRCLDTFVNLPLILYKDDPYFVPKLLYDEKQTLDPSKNPASEHCEFKLWLVYKNGVPAGRIGAIINHNYIKKWGNRYGRFGYVDFIEDFTVAELLFKTAEEWLIKKGMIGIHGPLGFCDLDPEGMLVEGFNTISTFTTIYNYSYYPEFMNQLGYSKDVDWLEFELTVPEMPSPIIRKLAYRAMKRYNLHNLEAKSKKDLKKYIPDVFKLLNRSYSNLYAVTELTEKQIKYYTKMYLFFFSVDFVKLILNSDNELVAFGLALPSLSKAMQKSRGKLFPFGFFHILKALKHNDRAELLLIGVDPRFQGKGVNAILLDNIVLNNPLDIKIADINPQLESNVNVISQWKYFDIKQNKRRRAYFKNLLP